MSRGRSLKKGSRHVTATRKSRFRKGLRNAGYSWRGIVMQTKANKHCIEQDSIIKLDTEEQVSKCCVCSEPIVGSVFYCSSCREWFHYKCATSKVELEMLDCPICKKTTKHRGGLYCPSCEKVFGIESETSSLECPSCKVSLWLVPCERIGGKEELVILLLPLALIANIAIWTRTIWGFDSFTETMPEILQDTYLVLIVALFLLWYPAVVVHLWLMTRHLLAFTPAPYNTETWKIPNGEFVPKFIAQRFQALSFGKRLILRYYRLLRYSVVAMVGLIAFGLIGALFHSLMRGCR